MGLGWMLSPGTGCRLARVVPPGVVHRRRHSPSSSSGIHPGRSLRKVVAPGRGRNTPPPTRGRPGGLGGLRGRRSGQWHAGVARCPPGLAPPAPPRRGQMGGTLDLRARAMGWAEGGPPPTVRGRWHGTGIPGSCRSRAGPGSPCRRAPLPGTASGPGLQSPKSRTPQKGLLQKTRAAAVAAAAAAAAATAFRAPRGRCRAARGAAARAGSRRDGRQHSRVFGRPRRGPASLVGSQGR